MIKRTGALLLTLLYVITAAGFVLNLNYCCNNLTSVKINAPAPAKTKMMVCKSKCCQEKHIEIKVKDVHQAQLSQYFDKLFAFQLPITSFADFLFRPHQVLFARILDKSPPDKTPDSKATLIKNRVFRI